MFKPKSEVPANLTIFDIAGLVKGASEGRGIGNAFLSNIAAVDGIYHVVRAFDDAEIVHEEGVVDPVDDLTTIYDELRLKDLKTARTMEDIFHSKSKRGQDKLMIADAETMKACGDWLEAGNWLSTFDYQNNQIDAINQANFLTAKPVVYLVNMSESNFVSLKNKYLPKIMAWVKEKCPGPVIPFSATFETTLATMNETEKKEYITSLGAKCSMLDRIINTGYSALELIHFFTCGDDEVKCWTIRKGSKAPQAAGTIHSDFEKAFICAEVYKYKDLVEQGSEAAVRANVGIQQKGKDYVVEDGDIMFFKHNARK